MVITMAAMKAPGSGVLEHLNTRTLLRIHAGAFFIPQIYYKYKSFEGVSGFLGKAGFYPASLWVLLAGLVETVIALALIFNVWTRQAALMAVGVLMVAGATVAKVRGLSWLFNHGGVEYHVFWALICFYVFVDSWQEKSRGR